jgi:uncharacterized protein YbaR (Trm112 family)
MGVDKDLLAILCCPETKQPVHMADESLVTKLNDSIRSGRITNKGKQPVTECVDGGLVRADSSVFYPIRENIPVMLIEEGILLEQIS